MDFTGRVAFITGATRGVGKALALGLARHGCDIVVTGKSVTSHERLPGSIHETAQEVEALGRRALPIRLNVRHEEEVETAVEQALAHFGRIDILINNAGALFWQPLAETPLKKFDLVMEVNARGAFACTRAVVPAMRKQGWGHILMMSPPINVNACAGKVAYSISKFGMTMIAHGLAAELAGTGVACNALWPVTMIESYATINWGLGGPALWRKPDILVDAALRLFAKDPREFTGHALFDEDFLRGEGVADFTPYRCDPEHEPPKVGFDFRYDAG